MSFRTERDSLGEQKIPKDALYGVQTYRAVENFPITGLPPHPEILCAYGVVKKCAAQANMKAALLPPTLAKPIILACTELLQGRFIEHFIIDKLANITSFNMNVNEIIANRALEITGEAKGNYNLIHPNDHVNMSQSTNDTFPTAIAIAILIAWPTLKVALEGTKNALWAKSIEFQDILKTARTHLQDAVPTSLGVEFHAYGSAIEQGIRDLKEAIETLKIVPIGGTAAGTGVNAPPSFIQDFLSFAKAEGYPLEGPSDLLHIQHSRVGCSKFSSHLRLLAIELVRIANDLRLLASGPTGGISEIILPALQPGSSIMPGKTNPVLPEALNMLAFRILGNDTMVAYSVQAGQLELNVMMPVMIDAILDSMKMLTRFLPIFTEKCIQGITPNPPYIERNLERNPSLSTLLNPLLGYDKATEISKEAITSGKPIKTILLAKGLFTEAEIEKIFSRSAMLPKITPRKKN